MPGFACAVAPVPGISLPKVERTSWDVPLSLALIAHLPDRLQYSMCWRLRLRRRDGNVSTVSRPCRRCCLVEQERPRAMSLYSLNRCTSRYEADARMLQPYCAQR